MTSRTVCIVSCTAHKRDTRMPAENLYSSDLFYKSRRFAQANFDSWLILSAKHGLIKPDQVIEPYDCNLGSLSAVERATLSKKVFRQASLLSIEDGARLTSICGEDYEDLLDEAGITFVRRLEFALPIGKKIKALGEATDPCKSQDHLEAAYKTIARLAKSSKPLRLKEVVGQAMPQAGVYLFFDEREKRMKDLSSLRVVRVGTHGVASGSKATLRNRMRTHFGTGSGDGNHRSSIFRLHVGRSFLNAQLASSVGSWGAMESDKSVLLAERQLEQIVSKYLSELYVALIDVPGMSDKTNDRAYIEQNLIALFSNKCKPLDPPGYQWLGSHSDKREIRKSGLWNVNHVGQRFDPEFLDIFDYYASVTLGDKPIPTQPIAPANWQARVRENDMQLTLI
jgi:uncharacterized protein DUF6884